LAGQSDQVSEAFDAVADGLLPGSGSGRVRTVSKSTAATSTAFVDTEVNRSPVTHRL
jgi:hypothetical protein